MSWNGSALPAASHLAVPARATLSGLVTVPLSPSGAFSLRNRSGAVHLAADLVGWYAPGTRLGDPGSAVILGHVDSKGGPAVFFRLRELRRGDAVTIRRADGSSVRFVVHRTEQHPKDRFPTDAVYYPTLTPTLRLVTCGGEFDATIGRYRSNLIVFATMAP